MDSILETEVNAMITRRILAYHQSLVDGGQIREVTLAGISPPTSDYSQSERRHSETFSECPAPPRNEPPLRLVGVGEGV